MLRSQTLTVARAAPIQFLAHWLFTPRRDTLRRMIKIAYSGVVNFISWHRAEFRPARGRSISSSGGTAAASVGSDVRFVTKTAKPSARESAGGFAFVPPTCRMGQNRRAKKKWCSAAAAFLRRQNAELQTPRCEIGFRSSFRNLLASDVGVTSNCTSALAGCGAVLCFSPQKAMLFLLALCERAASTRRG